jgi:hypothetical protein
LLLRLSLLSKFFNEQNLLYGWVRCGVGPISLAAQSEIIRGQTDEPLGGTRISEGCDSGVAPQVEGVRQSPLIELVATVFVGAPVQHVRPVQ